MSDVDNLATHVAAERSVPDSAAALVHGLAQLFMAARADAGALGAEVLNKAKSLVAAMLVGTAVPLGTTTAVTKSEADNAADAAVTRRASIRMLSGKPVEVLRVAYPTDPGYDNKNGAQSLVRHADGSQAVVVDKDIPPLGEPKPQPQPSPAAQPKPVV